MIDENIPQEAENKLALVIGILGTHGMTEEEIEEVLSLMVAAYTFVLQEKIKLMRAGILKDLNDLTV